MTKQVNTPSLKSSKAAARKPSAAVVTKATPQGAMAAVAQVLAKAAPAAPAAPVQAAPAGTHGGIPVAQLPKFLQARGAGPGKAPAGAAGLSVKLGKAPSISAGQNVAWWAGVQAQLAAGNGVATLTACMAANVPGHFVTYAVRRGWLLKV